MRGPKPSAGALEAAAAAGDKASAAEGAAAEAAVEGGDEGAGAVVVATEGGGDGKAAAEDGKGGAAAGLHKLDKRGRRRDAGAAWASRVDRWCRDRCTRGDPAEARVGRWGSTHKSFYLSSETVLPIK
jgi:hypothetical protein